MIFEFKYNFRVKKYSRSMLATGKIERYLKFMNNNFNYLYNIKIKDIKINHDNLILKIEIDINKFLLINKGNFDYNFDYLLQIFNLFYLKNVGILKTGDIKDVYSIYNFKVKNNKIKEVKTTLENNNNKDTLKSNKKYFTFLLDNENINVNIFKKILKRYLSISDLKNYNKIYLLRGEFEPLYININKLSILIYYYNILKNEKDFYFYSMIYLLKNKSLSVRFKVLNDFNKNYSSSLNKYDHPALNNFYINGNYVFYKNINNNYSYKIFFGKNLYYNIIKYNNINKNEKSNIFDFLELFNKTKIKILKELKKETSEKKKARKELIKNIKKLNNFIKNIDFLELT